MKAGQNIGGSKSHRPIPFFRASATVPSSGSARNSHMGTVKEPGITQASVSQTGLRGEKLTAEKNYDIVKPINHTLVFQLTLIFVHSPPEYSYSFTVFISNRLSIVLKIYKKIFFSECGYGL